MSIIHAAERPAFDLGGTLFRPKASPSCGATETSVWQVEIAPGTPATPHSLTREEVFVVLDGLARVSIAGEDGQAGPGDAFVVPAGAELLLVNDGPDVLRLVCCLPVGGQARLADGTTFTPPWAE